MWRKKLLIHAVASVLHRRGGRWNVELTEGSKGSREGRNASSYMHRKDCGRHNLVWFYGKKIHDDKKTKEKKVESTEGFHVRGRAPFSKTFMIYISCAFCLGLMCWASAWDVSFIFFSSSSCCNSFKSLVSYISPSPNGAINRLHPHIHYSKRCHSAISSAVNSQSWSSAAIILVMDYNWFTLKQQYTSSTDGP